MREAADTRETGASQRVSAPSIGPRMRACVIGLFALVAFLSLAGPALAAPATTVSLTFDDGRPTQMAAAQQLVSHGMTGTFYIITAKLGMPGVMSLSDVSTLDAEGM